VKVCVAARLAGGVGVYAQTLLRALSTIGSALRIHLATPDPVPRDLADRVTVHGVPHVPGLPTHPGWLLDALAFRQTLRPLVSELDVVHFTDARHALFSTGLGTPVVGTMNDYFYATVTWRISSVRRFYRDWPARYPLYHLARVGERRALRRLSRILAISDAVAEVRPPPTILFVGGNFQRKGLLTLLRAFPVVLARSPQARLLVVGRSHYTGGAIRMARRLGVLDHCDFLGAVSHEALLGHYARASVLAMPSLMEAFGIPYLEAMSCGLPVLATGCEGPDEYLVHEHNALVVAPGDTAGLAEGLLRLLGDPPLRDRLRAGGWETARRFTPERMATETQRVYRSVVEVAPWGRA
jgi:glycosyltransferase involved in cell wall biosynthesis